MFSGCGHGWSADILKLGSWTVASKTAPRGNLSVLGDLSLGFAGAFHLAASFAFALLNSLGRRMLETER